MGASKRKGTAFESDVVRYLRAAGFPRAERRALSGSADRGDIAGFDEVTWECKAAKAFDLAGWMDETKVEQANNGTQWGVLVVKRPRKPVADAYCVVPLWQLTALLKEASAS